MEQEVKLCDEVETVGELTYLGDRMGAGGGCEAAVTARTRCWWVKFRECGELLCGRRFRLRQKGAVYKSYVRPAILYGCEVWCLKESDVGIFPRTEIDGESNVWSTAQRQKKIYGFGVHAGFEGNYRSVDYGKQCLLVWSCVEDRRWSCLANSIIF